MKPVLLYAPFLMGLAALAAGCTTGPSAPTAVTAAPYAEAASGAAAQSRLAPLSAQQDGDLVPAVVGAPPALVDATAYRIGPDDVLKISVFQVADLSTEERVSDAGTIVMPLIGVVQVAGLTPAQAEAKIAGALAQDYLQNPQVDIFVSQQANMNVAVGGAVQKPGVFPLSGETTLLKAIAQAGGVTGVANEKEVVIFRMAPDGNMKAYVVNLKQVARGKLADPVLAGNDKVIVPKSGSIVVLKSVTDTLRGFVRFPVLDF